MFTKAGKNNREPDGNKVWISPVEFRFQPRTKNPPRSRPRSRPRPRPRNRFFEDENEDEDERQQPRHPRCRVVRTEISRGDGHVQRIHVGRHRISNHVVACRQHGAVRPGLRRQHQATVAPQIMAVSFLRAGAGGCAARHRTPGPQRSQFFPTRLSTCTSGCSKVVPMARKLSRRLERTAARLAHDQKMRAKSAQFRTTAPRFSALAMPSTAASSSGRGEFFRSVSNSAAAEFGHGQRALMQLVAGDGFQQLPVRRHKRRSSASDRARSSGSSFSSHAGVSSAETTVYGSPAAA